MKTLYVHRSLINAEHFIKWAKDQGFEKTLDPEDLHVTIAFSKKEVDWSKWEPKNNNITVTGWERKVGPLGDEGAVVLHFESPSLQDRWKEFKDGGCSWDWDGYKPHVSITYKGNDIDLSKVNPYNGPLIFGPEEFKEVDLNWKDKVE